MDVAFLRRENHAPGLAFKLLVKEPLVAVLSSDHRLAARKAIRPQDIAGETFIAPTKVAPALKVVIDDYAAKSGIRLKPQYEAENLSMAMSLVVSTGGITLLPLLCREYRFRPLSFTRPLHGSIVPTIDLVIGYDQGERICLAQALSFASGHRGGTGFADPTMISMDIRGGSSVFGSRDGASASSSSVLRWCDRFCAAGHVRFPAVGGQRRVPSSDFSPDGISATTSRT